MFDILEGKNIRLRKAKDDDYSSMLLNVWGDEEVYKWMLYAPTLNEKDAIDRNQRSKEFQKEHYAYYIALKSTDEAIGLCAIKEVSLGHFEESGICIGQKYQGKGYGKEIVNLLLDLAFNKLNALDFNYSYFIDNEKSKKIAEYFDFKYLKTYELIRPWDNEKKIIESTILTKEEYKKRDLYLKQKELLDTFLEKGAITKAQYNKSFNCLTEKMGYKK